jgi:hypothetical protein
LQLNPETIAAFDRLFEESVARGPEQPIAYELAAPKWQFLCYLCKRKGIVLHGSGNPSIAELRPRKGRDTLEFGDREAVYAAADGVWPIFYATLNRNGREGPTTSMVNGCVRVVRPDAVRGDYYFFSIDADPAAAASWRDGTIYLLSDQLFERQPLPQPEGGEIESTQVASRSVVRPLAKLSVTPSDFPFLDRVRRHDPLTLKRRAAANPNGFPWLEDPTVG